MTETLGDIKLASRTRRFIHVHNNLRELFTLDVVIYNDTGNNTRCAIYDGIIYRAAGRGREAQCLIYRVRNLGDGRGAVGALHAYSTN